MMMTVLDDDPANGADDSDVSQRLPENFHRRVLDRLPTALVVVDDSGSIVYANDALERIVGWSGSDGIGSRMFEYIHPDDLSWLADAFVSIADRQDRSPDVADRPWAPLNFRLISRSGAIVPVEVTGSGALHDPDVDGIIYEVRLAYEREIVQSVLAGVASGGDLVGQLELVVDLVSASLIDIDSAILRVGDGRTEILAASTDDLRAVLERAAHTGELSLFSPAPDVPHFWDVDAIDTRFGADLTALSYLDAWNLDVASVADDACYRIVGFTEIHHVPAVGVRDRLAQAAELTAVILLRMYNDQLLDRAAHHDALTDLPNRLGLRRLVEEIRNDRPELAILFVDLDGFKSVNDAHGHQRGDEVLRTVARRLVAATGPDDFVARLGGDEFAVVLAPPIDGSFDAGAVSERLIEAIEAPLVVDGRPASVSASIGVTEVASSVDLDAAIAAADRAMYRAKRAGGGQLRRSTIR